MKSMQKFALSAAVAAMLLGGCAGMSAQDKNTAVGGVIGHEVGK
ncbi:MAG: hypothetical protein Q8O33_17505 [Pseudomonadota bacterium]|nr:hypothetical protein [Pseudomonadota bacterium]